MSRPIAIGGFLVSVISLGEAFALLFSVGLVCVPLSAVAADAIEKGSEDLLRNKTLCRLSRYCIDLYKIKIGSYILQEVINSDHTLTV